jgi:hypothetical protein
VLKLKPGGRSPAGFRYLCRLFVSADLGWRQGVKDVVKNVEITKRAAAMLDEQAGMLRGQLIEGSPANSAAIDRTRDFAEAGALFD